MSDDEQPIQTTQPEKGEPVEIPVPEREDVMRDLRKMAKPATLGAAPPSHQPKLPPPRRP